jgi:hypothetical protein
MFNRTYITPSRTQTEFITKTVIEQRAPTDESIKLVREYEEKAWNAVKSAAVHPIAGINAEFLAVDRLVADRKLRLAFKINGISLHADVYGDAQMHTMYKAIAEQVTNEIMMQMLIAIEG